MTTSFTFPDSTLEGSQSYSGGTLDGLAVTTSFDSVLRPQTLSVNTSNALRRAFAYDEASRLKSVSDGAHSASYSHLANSPLVEQITFEEGTTVRMYKREDGPKEAVECG